MQESATRGRPSVLLMGTRGILARRVAEGLLSQGTALRAIATPDIGGQPFRHLPTPAADVGDLPMVPSYVENSIVELGWSRGIPVWSGGATGSMLKPLVERLAPDVVVVACWPSRIPAHTLRLPRFGFLNVHPSLLPEFRGPAPLFWQLRQGMREGGITVHLMNDSLDEGPVLAQETLPFPPGASGEELDDAAGRLAAVLLGKVISDCDRLVLSGSPQKRGKGSYQSWPRENDFNVPTTWTASHAWNFMRGTLEWGVPHTIVFGEFRLVVEELIDCDPVASLDRPLVNRGHDVAAIQFATGVIQVRGWSDGTAPSYQGV